MVVLHLITEQVPAGKVVSKSDLPITISVGKDGLDDSIKVFKVEGGADGFAGTDGTDGYYFLNKWKS